MAEGLYDDGLENWQRNQSENQRVREEIYWEYKTRWLRRHLPQIIEPEQDHPMGHGARGTCGICKEFRGHLAAKWIECVKANESSSDVTLVMPGSEGAHWTETKYESEEEQRIDAARTRIRELEQGKLMSDWVLIGIECTIADLVGKNYPKGAYNGQRRLFR